MGMRLLPKSAVDKAKALDRQREIEEGKKLATRVDALRELQSVEERNLTAFREKTVAEVAATIAQAQARKESLLKEVSDLEGERALLLIPLDARWDEVHQAHARMTTWEEDLSIRESRLTESREDNLRLEQLLSNRESRLADDEERMQEALHRAAILLGEAKEILARQRNDAYTAQMSAELRETQLIARETAIAARERDAAIVAAYHEKVAEENEKERVRLLDQRATLERAFTRLNLQK